MKIFYFALIIAVYFNYPSDGYKGVYGKYHDQVQFFSVKGVEIPNWINPSFEDDDDHILSKETFKNRFSDYELSAEMCSSCYDTICDCDDDNHYDDDDYGYCDDCRRPYWYDCKPKKPKCPEVECNCHFDQECPDCKCGDLSCPNIPSCPDCNPTLNFDKEEDEPICSFDPLPVCDNSQEYFSFSVQLSPDIFSGQLGSAISYRTLQRIDFCLRNVTFTDGLNTPEFRLFVGNQDIVGHNIYGNDKMKSNLVLSRNLNYAAQIGQNITWTFLNAGSASGQFIISACRDRII